MKKKKIDARSTRIPIYNDAAFYLGDTGTTRKAFQEETEHPRAPETYIYSRYRNPTVAAVEEQIMELEKCNWALLTQSGMSAIETALSIFQRGEDTGTWLFFSDIYGGTNSFIDSVLCNRRGIDIKRFYPTDGRYDQELFRRALEETKPRLVFFEAISNPMLIVSDGEAIIEMAKKAGAVVLLDNTFASPYLWHPLEAGADIVIHSATKFLSGHNNITAGVVCGNDRQMEKDAVQYRKLVGHMLSPTDAYHLGIQLETFALRFERHCLNAARLAETLAAHERVETVLYPGLKDHLTHPEAQKLFKGKGFGPMLTFDLKPLNPDKKREAAECFISAVSHRVPFVPSLGDTQTILLHVESIWGEKYPMPGMIRLSVGIEDFQMLEAAILEGLEAITV